MQPGESRYSSGHHRWRGGRRLPEWHLEAVVGVFSEAVPSSRVETWNADDGELWMLLFPSERWLEEYVALLNSSEEFAEAAAEFEGDLSYVFEAEPDLGVPRDIWAWADVSGGRCTAARYDVPPEEGAKAQFVVSAPYSVWKQVVTKELDPVRGLMEGCLRVKGHLPTLLRYVRAANELVYAAGEIPTHFVDEPSTAA